MCSKGENLLNFSFYNLALTCLFYRKFSLSVKSLDHKITSILIQNFRNHKNLLLKPKKKLVFLVGENGAGKTSVLEAISLLSPGKGILGSSALEQCRKESSKEEWLGNTEDEEAQKNNSLSRLSYNIEVELNNTIPLSIESTSSGICKKIVKVNKKQIQKQLDLFNWIDVVWFTSKMQYDLQSSSFRRKFIDRLSFYIENKQSKLVTEYEKLTKNRLSILIENRKTSEGYISAIEKQISICCFEIAKNRNKMISLINKNSTEVERSMPKLEINLSGELEDIIKNNKEEYLLEIVQKKLSEIRKKDRDSKQTNFGTNKTKVEIKDKDKNKNLSFLSSGEQKMIFLSLMGSVSDVIRTIKKRSPIILLDEMVSFLDKRNTEKVLEELAKNSSQVWITNPIMPEEIKNEELEVIKID